MRRRRKSLLDRKIEVAVNAALESRRLSDPPDSLGSYALTSRYPGHEQAKRKLVSHQADFERIWDQ